MRKKGKAASGSHSWRNAPRVEPPRPDCTMKTARQAMKASPRGASVRGRTMRIRLARLVTMRAAAKKVRPCEMRQAKMSAMTVMR